MLKPSLSVNHSTAARIAYRVFTSTTAYGLLGTYRRALAELRANQALYLNLRKSSPEQAQHYIARSKT